MTTMSSQITSLMVVYSIVYSGADQRKHQSSASLAFVRGIHRGPVNFPHKWSVTRKMFQFDDVIMCQKNQFTLFTNNSFPNMSPGHLQLPQWRMSVDAYQESTYVIKHFDISKARFRNDDPFKSTTSLSKRNYITVLRWPWRDITT